VSRVNWVNWVCSISQFWYYQILKHNSFSWKLGLYLQRWIWEAFIWRSHGMRSVKAFKQLRIKSLESITTFSCLWWFWSWCLLTRIHFYCQFTLWTGVIIISKFLMIIVLREINRNIKYNTKVFFNRFGTHFIKCTIIIEMKKTDFESEDGECIGDIKKAMRKHCSNIPLNIKWKVISFYHPFYSPIDYSNTNLCKIYW